MFGGYRWSVKQTNLRLFLDQTDAKMHEAGIEIRIVGDIPTELRSEFERRYVAARASLASCRTPFLTSMRGWESSLSQSVAASNSSRWTISSIGFRRCS